MFLETLLELDVTCFYSVACVHELPVTVLFKKKKKGNLKNHQVIIFPTDETPFWRNRNQKSRQLWCEIWAAMQATWHWMTYLNSVHL